MKAKYTIKRAMRKTWHALVWTLEQVGLAVLSAIPTAGQVARWVGDSVARRRFAIVVSVVLASTVGLLEHVVNALFDYVQDMRALLREAAYKWKR